MKKELIWILYAQAVMFSRKQSKLLCNLSPSQLSYCSFFNCLFIFLTQTKDKIENSALVSWPHQRFSSGSFHNFNSCAWNKLYFPHSRSAKFVFLHVFYRLRFHYKPYVCIQACNDEQSSRAVRSQA